MKRYPDTMSRWMAGEWGVEPAPMHMAESASDGQVRPLPPLPVAAARGDIEALTALLAEGIDINATTRTQPRSCLMEACKGNSDRAVDFLIAKGCGILSFILRACPPCLAMLRCLLASCHRH